MEYYLMKKRHLSLASLLETGKFSDCCFIIDGEKIEAHKLILASCSPVFEAMLFGPLASSEIVVNDIVASEFRQMLKFIYTDYVEFPSTVNAWSLVYIAKKYLLNDLLIFCLQYIRSELGAKNVIMNLDFAVFFNEDFIRNFCLKNIKMYPKVLLNYYYHMRGTTLCTLLDESDFNLKESELILLCLKWAKNECAERNLEITKDNLRTILKDYSILSRLRILCVDVDDMHETLKEILNDQEIECLKACQVEMSRGNIHKLMNLGLCFENCPRISIPLERRTTLRTMLKTGEVFYAKVESRVTTEIVVNKCIIVSGFLLPSRRKDFLTKAESYTEYLNVSITNLATRSALHIVFKDKVMFESTYIVKIEDPLIFEEMVPYSIEISWSPSCLTWSNAYLLNYFSPTLVNKDAKIEFRDPYKYGFIQGLCYCSFQ